MKNFYTGNGLLYNENSGNDNIISLDMDLNISIEPIEFKITITEIDEDDELKPLFRKAV